MGALARINRLQVAIIGIVLSILVVAGVYIGLIKPLNQQMDEANARFESEQQRVNQIPDAKKDLAKAKQDVATAKRKWAVYDRRFMPNINITNLFSGTKQLWNEQIVVLGPKVTRFLNADTSVRVASANISIPSPSGDPNAVARKSFVYPLGSVTVNGNFEQIMRHAERWNRFDRLVLVDGLSLSGNSPNLTGTYTLTCYIFTRGDQAGPAIPQAGQGQGGGFPGGGFPPGGFGPEGAPPFGPEGGPMMPPPPGP